MLREFYIERRRAELPVFLNVLKALPKEQLAYKPHDRSPSAEQVAYILTSELLVGIEAVRDNEAELKLDAPPPLEEMIAVFEKRSHELIDAVSKMDDEAWNRKAQF